MPRSRRLEVRVLGAPRIVQGDRTAAGPRGRKSWAVLTRLALSSRPLARTELSALLFPDAEDPLGALRWALAEMRRALGREDLFRGDPLELPPDLAIDVRALGGATEEAVRVSEDAGELLAGWEFPGCPEFESWLTAERSRAAARVEAHLRAAAMRQLASGNTEAAVRLAGRAVAANPLDEALHELLVRSLARAGDRAAAEAQVLRAERLLADSLGTPPSPSLRAALEDGPPPRRSPVPASAATAGVLIESGKAAMAAGAYDAGIQSLRRAIVHSEGTQRVEALLRLGSALVHALRGRDEAGAVYLHEAAQRADEAGETAMAVTALRELAFVDIQAGRVATAEERIREAEQLAGDDDALRAGVWAMQGMFLADRANHAEASRAFRASIDAAERAGDRRQAAWSRALLGRSALLTGELAGAARLLAESIETCRQERWLAFLPFPMAMAAEVALARNERPEVAERLLQESFALGCELGDPCWEALGASGLARVALARGDPAAAWEHAFDGHQRCIRHPDRYVWIEGWVLLTLLEAAQASGRRAEAADARRALTELAMRTEQPDLLSRLESGAAGKRRQG